eukprot:50082-Eustigmatos_ZCMA.PRE.1
MEVDDVTYYDGTDLPKLPRKRKQRQQAMDALKRGSEQEREQWLQYLEYFHEEQAKQLHAKAPDYSGAQAARAAGGRDRTT